MKNYLRLFLILISFNFVLNVAQADIPENIAQAHDEFVWEVMGFDRDREGFDVGTAFAIGDNMFVTNFHVLQGSYKKSKRSNALRGIFIKKGDQVLQLKQVIRVDAVEDLVIFTANGTESLKPPISKPLTSEPPTSEPLTSEPPTSEPLTSEPPTSEPLTLKPPTSEPLTSEPPTSEPLTSEPPTSEPLTSEPPTSEPLTLKPPTEEIPTFEPKVINYVKLSDQDPYPSGDLFVLGYPLGVKTTLRLQEIFENPYNYEMKGDRYIAKGISGGLVLNRQREFVGVAYKGIGNILVVRKVSQLKKLLRGDIGLNCSNYSVLECIKKERRRLKRSSSPRAQYSLGSIFLEEGTLTMKREAKKLIFKASKKGHARAIITYAGLLANLDEAVKLLLPLSEKGSFYAQDMLVQILYNQLADNLVNNIDMKNENKEKAIYWIRKLEKEGLFKAKFVYAKILDIGFGVEQDTTKALELYEELADKGLQDALEVLVIKYLTGDGVQKDSIKGLMMLDLLKKSGYNLSPKTQEILLSVAHDAASNLSKLSEELATLSPQGNRDKASKSSKEPPACLKNNFM